MVCRFFADILPNAKVKAVFTRLMRNICYFSKICFCYSAKTYYLCARIFNTGLTQH